MDYLASLRRHVGHALLLMVGAVEPGLDCELDPVAALMDPLRPWWAVRYNPCGKEGAS